MSTSADSGCCSRLEDELSTSLNATEVESSVILSAEIYAQNNNQISDVLSTNGNVYRTNSNKPNPYEENAESESLPLLDFRTPGPNLNPCCLFFRNITVEPWLFLAMFATFLQAVVMKNLIIEKVCIFTFGINDTGCMNTTNATKENYIQVQASNLEMYSSLIDTVPGIFFSIFLGAFSDRYSRKIPMIIPLVGCIISSVAMGLCAYFMAEIPPEFLPLTGLPKGLTGGIIAAMVAALSYVSDSSAPEKRTVRVAAVEGVFLLGQPLGTLAGGFIYQYSYVLVFAIGSASYCVAIVYILAFIRETGQTQTVKSENVGFCRKFFNLTSYKETLATFFKSREENARFYILMLLGVMTFMLMPYIGQSSILYLFLRLKFSWDLTTYSYFGSLSSVCMSLGLIFGAVIFVRLMKLNDMILAVIGILGSTAVSLAFAFINSSSMIYLVCIPLLLCGVTSLAVRSTISKLVPRDEQGKVFSVLGSFEAVVPFLASLLYSQVYNATEATFPEAVFIMSAAIFIIPMSLIM